MTDIKEHLDPKLVHCLNAINQYPLNSILEIAQYSNMSSVHKFFVHFFL